MRRRQGFTLVEMLVAIALIVFIMAIISEAFVAASKTFRDLKAAGDLADQLRSTTAILRRYLAADHFEARRRLSDPNFWAAGPPRQGFFRVWHGTASGQPPNYLEGNAAPDLTGTTLTGTTAAQSYRSANHALHFSVKLRGNTRSDFLSAAAPAPGANNLLTLGLPESRYQDTPNTYNAQWAEVVFFLRAIRDPGTGVQAVTSPTVLNPAGVPLYGLYMRQFLAASDSPGSAAQVGQQVQVTPPAATYLELSLSPVAAGNGNLNVNSPRDLTQPVRRFGSLPPPPQPNPPNPATALAGVLYFTDPLTVPATLSYPRMKDSTPNTALWGSDLLLTNVVSFDVRLLAAGQADFLGMHQLGQQFNSGNPNNPDFNPKNANGPMVFDTWSSVKDDLYDYSLWNTPGHNRSIPMWNGSTGPIIQAIQITLRIWNERAEQTRQVTIEVPL
jgi:prepilin-type N-terminal cleavage/methylation domain-containing protein